MQNPQNHKACWQANEAVLYKSIWQSATKCNVESLETLISNNSQLMSRRTSCFFNAVLVHSILIQKCSVKKTQIKLHTFKFASHSCMSWRPGLLVGKGKLSSLSIKQEWITEPMESFQIYRNISRRNTDLGSLPDRNKVHNKCSVFSWKGDSDLFGGGKGGMAAPARASPGM